AGVAMAGGDGNAAAGIRLDRRRGADQLQLEGAAVAPGARKLVDLVADRLPDRLGVQVQGTGFERVVGDHQPVAGRGDGFAIGGRDRQPPLVVDGDEGLALEHSALPTVEVLAATESPDSPGFPTCRHLRSPPTGLSTTFTGNFRLPINELRRTSESGSRLIH